MAALYRSRDVLRIVGIPRSALRACIAHGFVVPSRGARREHLFTFHDLIVLRMARALEDARLSRRRVSTSLRRLRARLPEDLPLTGLRIAAVGRDVVVREGPASWRADDGQYLLALEVSTVDGAIRIADRVPQDWFSQALALEDADQEEAVRLYRRAIDQDPCAGGAYANLGRLLHEGGRLPEAEAVYDAGQRACPGDPLLLYNFALLREDQSRWEQAIDLYMRALELDPTLSEAHYNLALVYEAQRRQKDALRHFSAYRKLTGGPARS
jgi:tetratricopeptide (TPR) repeat protein